MGIEESGHCGCVAPGNYVIECYNMNGTGFRPGGYVDVNGERFCQDEMPFYYRWVDDVFL